jgi:UDP-glucose 4-epimerase
LTILVTGGAGYIGSATVERLQAKGESVVVLDDLFRGHRSAECVHLAALAYVGESVLEPAKYFENNAEQGISLIGALMKAGVGRIVFSSTCATYGEPTQVPISESCAQRPVNPYGWSKLLMERLLASYDTAYGLRSISLRYFNAAGATERCGELHEPESHLVPNVLKAASGELPHVSVFGSDYPTPDGTAVRDYVHVADLADAHILALEHLRSGGNSDFLNLGTGGGHSVMEVIETARIVTGKPIPTKMEGRRTGDPPKLVADASKAKKLLGWEPAMSDLSTILRSQWEWRQSVGTITKGKNDA